MKHVRFASAFVSNTTRIINEMPSDVSLTYFFKPRIIYIGVFIASIPIFIPEVGRSIEKLLNIYRTYVIFFIDMEKKCVHRPNHLSKYTLS